MNWHYLIMCFLLSAGTNAATERVKIEEKRAVSSEVEEMFDEFALMKNERSKSSMIKNEVHKPAFIWPVDIKAIKYVIIEATNRAKIELKNKSNIINAHVGVIIAIENTNKGSSAKKNITIKHVVDGGICYFTIIKNVENVKLPVGELVKSGEILGKSQSITFEIRQMNVQVPPSLDMLMPAINPALVRVISRM